MNSLLNCVNSMRRQRQRLLEKKTVSFFQFFRLNLIIENDRFSRSRVCPKRRRRKTNSFIVVDVVGVDVRVNKSLKRILYCRFGRHFELEFFSGIFL